MLRNKGSNKSKTFLPKSNRIALDQTKGLYRQWPQQPKVNIFIFIALFMSLIYYPATYINCHMSL